MIKNKKGFTLLEVLATTVIFGLIFAIAVPTISNVIDSSKRSAFKNVASQIIRELITLQVKEPTLDIATINENNIDEVTGIPTDNIAFITLSNLGTEIFVEILGRGTFLGYTAYGTIDNISVITTLEHYAGSKPVINLIGASSIIMEKDATYIEAGATATGVRGEDLTSQIVTAGTGSTSVVGTFNVTYNVSDKAGIPADQVIRSVQVLAKAAPTVAFGTNGNSTYATTRSTTVTVTDNTSVNNGSLEYQWTTSTTAPTEASFTTSFTNGQSISSPAGVSGGYYLWILAKDIWGNTAITRSNIFNLDNSAPTVATATLGTITSNSVVVTGAGTDAQSGIAKYAFSKDNGATWTASQTGASYTFTGLVTGTYQIKVRVYNGVDLTLDSTAVSASTVAILTPTYSITPSGWATSKTVTIDFKSSGYTKQYSLDGGTTWTTPTTQTQALTFNANGSVIARVTDGTNTITASTYNVTQVDASAPTAATASLGTITSNSIIVIGAGTDAESGVSQYAYSKDNGTTWTAAQEGNTYTFTGLTTGTYQFKVKVYNPVGATLISSAVSGTTATIVTPTYSITPSGWAPSKTVTIDYQTTGNTKQYSMDGGSTWTTSSTQTQNVVFNANGSVIARVTDGTNTITASTYNVTQIEATAPTVAFGTNGNATYAKSQSTTVTVSDTGGAGVNAASLEYLWSTATSGILETDFTTTFTSGGTLTQSGVTGGYYLWILAKDNAGNTTITKSNVFNLDNTIPVITMAGTTPITITVGSGYTDAGATATDNIDGTITSRITTVNNVNTSVFGTYTVTYNVTDLSGNAATQVVRTVNVALPVEYLIVGGGGGGGVGDDVAGGGGGGGAGGYLTGLTNITAGTYAITVGGGGAGGVDDGGGNGGNSSLFGLTAYGGGGGGDRRGSGSGGGSGGGGSCTGSGGTGTAGQGNNGGNSSSQDSSNASSGGGGGAGGVGGNPTSSSQGVGGAGLSSSITGVAVCRAGGGGAGYSVNPGNGKGKTQGSASCGGSAGGGAAANGGAGAANTGGGGGGGGTYTATAGTFSKYGGAGGSGIVIIAYPGTSPKATGGTTYCASGCSAAATRSGYVIHVFTGSGNFVLN